ncbi:MAG: peptidylprolyl isomerase [Desulfobacteraceae bacterium]|nr:peptidylprolyl isomerase [Desulfobacteraceae bacterium]
MTLKNIRRILTFSLILFMPFAGLQSVADETVADKKIAVVNGVSIPSSEFDTEMDQFKRRMESQGQPVDPAQLEKLKAQVLNNLVNMELLYQQSQKKNILVKEEQVSSQIDELKKRYKSEPEYENALKEMKLTQAELSERIKKGIAIQELMEKEVISLITISEADAKTFYDANPQYFKQPESVHASHILIKVDTNADESTKTEAKKKITDIQTKVKNGEDFAELAKAFSEGPSGPKGGDLGFFNRGQMVKPFEDVAFALKKDEVSGIVETQFGYHLIKMIKKKQEGTTAFSEVKSRISDFLKKQKTQDKVGAYIETLKKTATIETFI